MGLLQLLHLAHQPAITSYLANARVPLDDLKHTYLPQRRFRASREVWETLATLCRDVVQQWQVLHDAVTRVIARTAVAYTTHDEIRNHLQSAVRTAWQASKRIRDEEASTAPNWMQLGADLLEAEDEIRTHLDAARTLLTTFEHDLARLEHDL